MSVRYSSPAYRLFQVTNTALMAVVVVCSVGPFLHILAVSFSTSSAVLNGAVGLIPVGFSLDAYAMALRQGTFLRSFLNSALYTVVGTGLSLFMTLICAYALSKNNLIGRKLLMRFVIVTMFFSGGLIPNYILITALRFTDRIWALVVPGAINVYYLIIVITFMKGIPASLEEAAAMDGFNPIQILFAIVVPLSKPVLAAISLFVAVGLWNDWFTALIYLNSNAKFPMMLFLRNIVQGSQAMSLSTQVGSRVNVLGISVKSATIMLVSVPIMLLYPFLQRYFISGVMIGSIKG